MAGKVCRLRALSGCFDSALIVNHPPSTIARLDNVRRGHAWTWGHHRIVLSLTPFIVGSENKPSPTMTVPSSYHVYNAFPSPTDDRFKGNPAAVIVLPDSDQTGEVLDDVLDVFPPASELQATAVKINLPMTAYIVPLASPAPSPKFALRWFNIAHEAPACGHATNASVTHIFNSERWKDVPQIELLSRNGVIIARRGDEGRVTFRFPAHLGLVEQNKQEAEEIVGKFAKAITKGSLGHVERVLRSDVFTVIQFSKDDKIGFEDLQLDLQELVRVNAIPRCATVLPFPPPVPPSPPRSDR